MEKNLVVSSKFFIQILKDEYIKGFDDYLKENDITHKNTAPHSFKLNKK